MEWKILRLNKMERVYPQGQIRNESITCKFEFSSYRVVLAYGIAFVFSKGF